MASLSGARCNATSSWLGALQADKSGTCCFVAGLCESIAGDTVPDIPVFAAVTAAQLDAAADGSSSAEMSLEEALKRERSRTTTAGITEFHWNPSKQHCDVLLLPYKGDLFIARAPANGADFAKSPSATRWQLSCVFKRKLTAFGGASSEVQWCPDGNWVLFVQDGEVCATSVNPLLGDSASAHADSTATDNDHKGAWQVTNGYVTVRLTHGAWESRQSSQPFRQGEADYLAQESFDRFRGFWASPCSQLLAFQSTRDSHIPPFHIRHQHSVDPYAGEVHRYPFPGGAAPIVTLHCCSLQLLAATQAALIANTTVQSSIDAAVQYLVAATANAPQTLDCQPYGHNNWYMSRCAWDGAQGLLLVACNRAQNQKDLMRFPVGCLATVGGAAEVPRSEDCAASSVQPRLLLRERSTFWTDVCSDVWMPLLTHTNGVFTASWAEDLSSSSSPSTRLLLWGAQTTGYRHLQLVRYDTDAPPTPNSTLTHGCCAAGGADSFTTSALTAGQLQVWRQGGMAEVCHVVTEGNWNVTSIDMVDVQAGIVFITGNMTSPLERTPMAVSLRGAAAPGGAAAAQATVELSVADPTAKTAPAFAHWFEETLTEWGSDMLQWGWPAGSSPSPSVAQSTFGVHSARYPTAANAAESGTLIALKTSSMTSSGKTNLVKFSAAAHGAMGVGAFESVASAVYRPRPASGSGSITDDPPAPSQDATNPLPTLFAFPVDGAQQTLLGALWLPPDAVLGQETPPKAVVSVYGGPGVQYVQAHYKYTGADRNVKALLADGFAVVRVDNRGSDCRSTAFEGAIFKSMGGVEIDDQAAAVQWLQARGVIADQRVGVTGWSYGGYASLLCALKYPSLFGTAVAGAPVTHWRLYDCGYTERYMGWPPALPAAAGLEEALDDPYCISSVAHHLSTLTAKSLGGAVDVPSSPQVLIVHGMLDENVHFRHTARLVAALQTAGAPHELLVLPTERHGPRTPAVRSMVLRRSAAFLKAGV